MLQKMRDNSKGAVAGLLIGFLVIIFALSGAEALFSSRNGPKPVVTVNSEDVSELQLERAIEQQKQQMRDRFGASVPEDFLTNDNLRQPAMETLIQRTLLNQAVARSKMQVSEARLNEVILSAQTFSGPDGKFDPQYYQQALRMMGHTPGSYKRELEQNIAVNQLVNAITASNFATPEEVDYLLALSGQTRDFNYAVLSLEQVNEQVSISENEIQAYYDGNSQQFAQPETVEVELIELSVRALMEQESVADDELQAEYQQYLNAFEAAAVRRAAHILLEPGNEEAINKVEAAIDADEDFAALAAEYSQDFGSRDSGGDLGSTTGDTFPAAFERALAELSVGEVAGPVTTDSGVHFIKLLDEQGGEPETFDEQREALTRQIKRTRAESRFVALLRDLEELSYNAESLEEVGETLELPVQQVGPFSRNGGPGVTAFSSVLDAAFSDEVLLRGNASEVIELAPDRVVVLKKTAHEPSYIKPLAEVTAEVEQIVREQKVNALLAEQGDELAAQLRAGTNFEQLAEEASLSLVAVEEVARSNTEQPRNVLSVAFDMPKPAGNSSVVEGRLSGGDYVLVELLAVNTPAPADNTEQRAAIVQSLASLQGNAEVEAYLKHLRATAKIEEHLKAPQAQDQ
ncbi:MAG TPA: SurA N-terminal domain-containing protein [Cellvibrionaceae bacterium]